MRHLKSAVPMLLLSLLCACGTENGTAQPAMTLRSELLSARGCSFDVSMTADYGTWTRDYSLSCVWDEQTGASLTVTEPAEVSGITATVSGDDAQVCFSDTVLALEAFSSRQLSPLAAPYLLGQCWASGYIASAGTDGELATATYTYGYGSGQLTVETWFSDQGLPVHGEISDGRAVLLTCDVGAFQFKTKDDTNEKQAAAADVGGGQS